MPANHSLRLREYLSPRRPSLSQPFDHLVVEVKESYMVLGDQGVDIVPGIADECSPLAIPGDIEWKAPGHAQQKLVRIGDVVHEGRAGRPRGIHAFEIEPGLAEVVKLVDVGMVLNQTAVRGYVMCNE